MQHPLLVDGDEQLVQTMSDGNEHVVALDDRFYRVYHDAGRDTFYTMLRVGGHQRSVAVASLPDLIVKLVQIHRVYRSYEDQCRRAKETAARERDRSLNKIANP